MLGIFFAIIVGLIVVFFLWFRQREQLLNEVKVEPHTKTVTLFVPGYGGNRTSFGGVVNRLDRYDLGTFSERTYIKSDGKFSQQKQAGFGNNSMVQLLFEDSRAPEKEVKQIYPYLQYLKAQGFDKMNLVGHSTGAPMSVAILTTYPNDSTIPKPEKLISIGGDFPLHPSESYLASGEKLPSDLAVLTIAGNIWGRPTDGLVKETEVRAIEPVVEPYVKSYQFVIINGSPLTAFHFMLHENPVVDKLIAEFLWS
ncbi:alpha/beta hydrolase [Candidatus Enterococcus ferrettii]|uniref:Alpha/beta hydrolase n=1 Tax=Candidatus Enterococcus ferrettii TaxID=2815324 RepID=A0ABV0EPW5_9ENTE|nr:alpha/beta hydrolase [Enterococcus sp. 665A]